MIVCFLFLNMVHLLFLCPVFLVAGVLTLSIDAQLGTSTEDCFERISIGDHLPNNAIYRNVTELTIAECENRCKQDKECQTYDYGIGAKGNATCNLSKKTEKQLKEEKSLIRNTDYDVYVRRFQCEQSPPSPLQPLFDENGHLQRPALKPNDADIKAPLADTPYDEEKYRGPNKPFPNPSYDRPDDMYNSKPDFDDPPFYGDHRPLAAPYRPERPYQNYEKPDQYDVVQLPGSYVRPRPDYPNKWRPDPYSHSSLNDDPLDTYGQGLRPGLNRPTENSNYYYVHRPNRGPRPSTFQNEPGYGNILDTSESHPSGPISLPEKPYRPNNYGENANDDNDVYVEIYDPPNRKKPTHSGCTELCYLGSNGPSYGSGGNYGSSHTTQNSYSNQNSYSQSNQFYESTQSGGYEQNNHHRPRPRPRPETPLKPEYNDPNPGYGGQSTGSGDQESNYGSQSSSYGSQSSLGISNSNDYTGNLGYGSFDPYGEIQHYGTQTDYSNKKGDRNKGSYGRPSQNNKPDNQINSSYGSSFTNSDNEESGGNTNSYGNSQASYGSSRPAHNKPLNTQYISSNSDKHGNAGSYAYNDDRKRPSGLQNLYGNSQASYGSSQAYEESDGNTNSYGNSQASYGSSRPAHNKPLNTQYISSNSDKQGYGSSYAYNNDRKRPYGLENLYGNNQVSYGSGQALYGASQASYGTSQAEYGTSQASYGATQAAYGSYGASLSSSNSASYGSNQASYDTSQAYYGNSQGSSSATYGTSHDITSNNQASYGNSQSYGSGYNYQDFGYQGNGYSYGRPNRNIYKGTSQSYGSGYGTNYNSNQQSNDLQSSRPDNDKISSIFKGNKTDYKPVYENDYDKPHSGFKDPGQVITSKPVSVSDYRQDPNKTDSYNGKC